MSKFNILYDFPTEKQCRLLRKITLKTGKFFEGTTKSEASDFITKHINELEEKECSK